MCKLVGRIKMYHRLAKVFEWYFQTFQKFFPIYFNFIES